MSVWQVTVTKTTCPISSSARRAPAAAWTSRSGATSTTQTTAATAVTAARRHLATAQVCARCIPDTGLRSLHLGHRSELVASRSQVCARCIPVTGLRSLHPGLSTAVVSEHIFLVLVLHRRALFSPESFSHAALRLMIIIVPQ